MKAGARTNTHDWDMLAGLLEVCLDGGFKYITNGVIANPMAVEAGSLSEHGSGCNWA